MLMFVERWESSVVNEVTLTIEFQCFHHGTYLSSLLLNNSFHRNTESVPRKVQTRNKLLFQKTIMCKLKVHKVWLYQNYLGFWFKEKHWVKMTFFFQIRFWLRNLKKIYLAGQFKSHYSSHNCECKNDHSFWLHISTILGKNSTTLSGLLTNGRDLILHYSE